MGGLSINMLTNGDSSLEQVKTMFRDYYRGMERQGLMIKLVDGGEDIWLESIKSGLGKYCVLIGARSGNELVGFLYGYIKVTPAYLGSKVIGYADSIYMKEDYRKGSVVLRMIRALERWFRDKSVDSGELQVLVQNEHTRKIWEVMGYTVELHQLRKRF